MKLCTFWKLCCWALWAWLAVWPARAELADTVMRVKPAMVLVGSFKATETPRFAFRGSGFVVTDAGSVLGNRVVTSAHVLVPAAERDPQAQLVVQVRAPDGNWQMRGARVLAQDQVHDLALLHLDGSAVSALTVGDSARVREGDGLAFTGFPIGGALGFAPVTHRATVSAITVAALPSPTSRQLNTLAIRSLRGDGAFDIFQLDATAYPGNSGGPLFDVDNGEVLGVVNMVLLKSTREAALSQPSGISYAVPSHWVRELLSNHPPSAGSTPAPPH